MFYDATMLNIGRAKQIFVDDLIIESVENVCRTWHQPRRGLDRPVIVADQPWENMVHAYCNGWQVLRDPEDNLFKCLYGDWYRPLVKPGEMILGKSVFNLLYAESEDGIHWRKPTFDIHLINGQPTNVVIPHAYNPGLILDPNPADQSERYKIIYNQFIPGSRDVAEIVAATSGDMIHWKQMSQKPTWGRQGSLLDDVIVMNYNPYGRLFVMNTRHYDMYAVARNLQNPTVGQFTLPYYPLDWRKVNKRRVWQSQSADFLHWTEPYPAVVPEDGQDELDECTYGMCQYPVGNITLGFLNCYTYVDNRVKVRLTYSRDGNTWRHLNKRQPFLAPRGEGTWDAYMTNITSRPIQVGSELYVFYSGSSAHHDWWISGAREGLPVKEATDMSDTVFGVGLAKLRPDGFVSLNAGPARRGIFITRPVISDGTQLVVNARCLPGGSITAEMVNIKDEVFPGYSRAECDVFTGDSTKHVFSWKGKTELPPAATERAEYPKAEFARFRKIRFYMEKAELYSLTLA